MLAFAFPRCLSAASLLSRTIPVRRTWFGSPILAYPSSQPPPRPPRLSAFFDHWNPVRAASCDRCSKLVTPPSCPNPGSDALSESSTDYKLPKSTAPPLILRLRAEGTPALRRTRLQADPIGQGTYNGGIEGQQNTVTDWLVINMTGNFSISIGKFGAVRNDYPASSDQ